MTQPALFLDRDGVINVDYGYVCKPNDFHFVEGILELVAAASQAGYLIVVITNQAGIGRGYYSTSHFHALMDWMKTRFSARGGRIDAVYYCPYHPDGIGEYRRESNCRKPAPGMLLQAKRELKIDLAKSILVGDKPSDMTAGRAAGVCTLLHLGGEKSNGFSIPIQRLTDVLPYLSLRDAT